MIRRLALLFLLVLAAPAGLLLASCRQEAQAPEVANAPQAETPSFGNVVLGNMELPAETAPAATFPALTGQVIDQAGLLTIPQEAALGERSAAIYRRTGRQFVIVTVTSLGGRPIDAYTMALARSWRIGEGGRNNGVLLVVAPTERRTRISFGGGLEDVLSIEATQRIIDEDLLPAFRQSRWFDGIDRASRQITARLAAPAAPQR